MKDQDPSGVDVLVQSHLWISLYNSKKRKIFGSYAWSSHFGHFTLFLGILLCMERLKVFFQPFHCDTTQIFYYKWKHYYFI